VLLGAESEGVHVDARGRRAAVVLVGLHLVEVGALALREAVLAVELELGNLHGVLAIAADARVEDDLREEVVDARLELRDTRDVVRVGANEGGVLVRGVLAKQGRGRRGSAGRLDDRVRRRGLLREERRDDAVRREIIRVVEGLGAANRGNPARVGAVNKRVALDHPEELLHGVVKVELELVGRGRDRLSASVLHLLDEVLVGLLGEAAALLRVEVDVIHVEGRGGEGLGRGRIRDTRVKLGVLAVLPRLEVNVDAHLVVLEGDEGNGKTRVAAEPELERHIERLRGRALARNARDRRLGGRARRIKSNARRALHEHKVVRVTDDRLEGADRASLRRELRPDLHPVTVLAVNALAANLNLNLLEEAVADVVEPAEALRRARRTERARRGR